MKRTGGGGMQGIGAKLRKAIEEQRRAPPRSPRGGGAAAAAMEPLREAAEQLRGELADVANLHLGIDPDTVWLDMFDKHLWISFDPARNVFIGSRIDSLWIEGGLREEHLEWPTAEACIDALVQACAQSALLAEVMQRLEPEPRRRRT